MGWHGVARQFGQDFVLVAKAGAGKQVDSILPDDLTSAQLVTHIKAVMAHRGQACSNIKNDPLPRALIAS